MNRYIHKCVIFWPKSSVSNFQEKQKVPGVGLKLANLMILGPVSGWIWEANQSTQKAARSSWISQRILGDSLNYL